MVWHHQCTNSTICPHVSVQGLQDQNRTKNAFGTLQKTSRGSSPENRYLSTKLQLLELSVCFGQSVFKGYKICAQSCIPHTCARARTHTLHIGMMADKESSLLDTERMKTANKFSIA